MSKNMWIWGLVFSLVAISGCVEEVKDDSRFRADPELSSAAVTKGFAVPDAGEIDLIEDMAGHRNAYKTGLAKLVEYYTASGDAVKLGWANRELAALNAIAQYRYVMPAAGIDASHRALDTINEADELFAEAEKLYKDSGWPFRDEAKLRRALRKYNLIIAKWPSSDKIDDCAYKAGKIYEHFKDYDIAVVYYQRAFQWDGNTPYPVRFKAAYILDRRLHMKKEALALYQMAYKNPNDQKYEGNMLFAKKRILEMTEPSEKIDHDSSTLPTGTE